MRTIVCHALIVTAVLIVGDYRFNDGRDTAALLAALRPDAIAGLAQLEAHHVNAAIDRELSALMLSAGP